MRPLPSRPFSVSAYLTLRGRTTWKNKKSNRGNLAAKQKYDIDNFFSFSAKSELTPGKICWLFNTSIARSASSNFEYFTKQLSAKMII